MSELSISSLTCWPASPCSPPGQRASYSQSGIHIQEQALAAVIVQSGGKQFKMVPGQVLDCFNEGLVSLLQTL